MNGAIEAYRRLQDAAAQPRDEEWFADQKRETERAALNAKIRRLRRGVA